MGYLLNKVAPARVTVSSETAFSMKLTVTSDDAELYPVKIFVMQEAVEVGDEPWFTCVASPVQIIDYPEDAPADPVDGVQSPYFRVDNVTIVSRSAVNLDNFIARIEEELAILEDNLDTLNTLDAL